MGKLINMTLGDQIVECEEVAPALLLPTVMKDSPNIDAIVSSAEKLLGYLPSSLTQCPWVIGSTNVDVLGQERQSASHREGLAYDLSPCYSAEELVPADKRCMGLAWDLVKMYLLRDLAQAGAICVEGDHLHVLWQDTQPMTFLPAVPTMAQWYPASDVYQDLAKPFFGLVLALDGMSLGPASPEQQEEFKTRFSI